MVYIRFMNLLIGAVSWAAVKSQCGKK